jgi:hypothetical protein
VCLVDPLYLLPVFHIFPVVFVPKFYTYVPFPFLCFLLFLYFSFPCSKQGLNLLYRNSSSMTWTRWTSRALLGRFHYWLPFPLIKIIFYPQKKWNIGSKIQFSLLLRTSMLRKVNFDKGLQFGYNLVCSFNKIHSTKHMAHGFKIIMRGRVFLKKREAKIREVNINLLNDVCYLIKDITE